MSKPRLLDLFCGAGGAAMGYSRAGFDVIGVDIKPQPRYPFDFRCGDAFKVGSWLLTGRDGSFDAVHASPPCQRWTAARNIGNMPEYPDLITPLRPLLEAAGLPWVIENVPAAPLRRDLVLCGSAFGLPIRRHRIFEASFPLMGPPCAHGRQTPRFPARASKGLRSVISVFGNDSPAPVVREAMDMPWATRLECAEAIPPAYTEHIGSYLMAEIERRAELVA